MTLILSKRSSSSTSEVGSLTVFLSVLAVALLAMVGLVVDAGRAIAAQGEAMAVAEQAARAGAGQLSIDALRSGTVVVDPAAAMSAAQGYLAAAGGTGSVSVSGNQVTVRIDKREPTALLAIVGIRQINVAAVATATDVHGVTEQD